MYIPGVGIVWDSEHAAFIWARPNCGGRSENLVRGVFSGGFNEPVSLWLIALNQCALVSLAKQAFSWITLSHFSTQVSSPANLHTVFVVAWWHCTLSICHRSILGTRSSGSSYGFRPVVGLATILILCHLRRQQAVALVMGWVSVKGWYQEGRLMRTSGDRWMAASSLTWLNCFGPGTLTTAFLQWFRPIQMPPLHLVLAFPLTQHAPSVIELWYSSWGGYLAKGWCL
ncbi:hypothetical protein EI94DRAFT_1699373 [Lactarius quietus]|nr:hypothetical protein EI94DRAFT_1699373 [Lactarius quietus]